MASTGATETPRKRYTAGSAPSAAEIRAVVVESGQSYPKGHPYSTQLADLITEWSADLKSAAFDALEAEDPREPGAGHNAIWDDLRPSEALELRFLVQRAVAYAAEKCEAVIVDELTAAGVAFATKYPNAPRSRTLIEG